MSRRPAVPAPATILAVTGLVVLVLLPLAALLQRAPWRKLTSELTTPEALTALRLSIVVSLGATAVAIIFGLPLAWLLARREFRGRSFVRALTIVPMVLPPVVGGVALLLAFGRRGLAGQWIERCCGIRLPFSVAGAILAGAFVALPFLVLTVESGMRSADLRFEEAAATLGAGRWRTFRRVTLPMIAPSLFAGIALAWARALGEFGATVTFAGNFPGKTQTLPLAVYLALESRPEGAIALSVLLLALSVAVLVALRPRNPLRGPLGSETAR